MDPSMVLWALNRVDVPSAMANSTTRFFSTQNNFECPPCWIRVVPELHLGQNSEVAASGIARGDQRVIIHFGQLCGDGIQRFKLVWIVQWVSFL